jgi:hypothetical protein
MKNVVLVTSSNRAAEKHTRRLWSEMVRLGALVAEQTGSPDVAFARNMALSAACNALRNFPERQVVVMVDDDMVGPIAHVEQLVARALETERPCSAVYATQSGHLAATRWRTGPSKTVQRDGDGRSLWLVGLGVLAIPSGVLLDTESTMPSFRWKDRVLTAFCECGVREGEWWAEDYQLSANLGGVRLEPIGFGHIKKMPLWPDQETLDLIAGDQELPEEDGHALHVRHHDELFPGEQESLLPKAEA